MLMALTLKSTHLSDRPGPQQRKEEHTLFLSPAFTLQSLLDSTHSELPLFTILYNKYSDATLRELARPKMTVSNKTAYAALEQSTIGQRPIWGTNALLGQWVSLEQLSPGTHTRGAGRGRTAGLARGAEGPPVSPSGLEGLSHGRRPQMGRASQRALVKMGCGPFLCSSHYKICSEAGPFLSTQVGQA